MSPPEVRPLMPVTYLLYLSALGVLSPGTTEGLLQLVPRARTPQTTATPARNGTTTTSSAGNASSTARKRCVPYSVTSGTTCQKPLLYIHETRRSDGHVDGVTVASRRVDAIDVNLKFRKGQTGESDAKSRHFLAFSTTTANK